MARIRRDAELQHHAADANAASGSMTRRPAIDAPRPTAAATDDIASERWWARSRPGAAAAPEADRVRTQDKASFAPMDASATLNATAPAPATLLKATPAAMDDQRHRDERAPSLRDHRAARFWSEHRNALRARSPSGHRRRASASPSEMRSERLWPASAMSEAEPVTAKGKGNGKVSA